MRPSQLSGRPLDSATECGGVTMRRLQTEILMFAVALAIVPLSARAQSGVLIGMATDPDPERRDRETPPAFSTLWIAHDAARARRLTTIPALVVPRRGRLLAAGLDQCLRTQRRRRQESIRPRHRVGRPDRRDASAHTRVALRARREATSTDSAVGNARERLRDTLRVRTSGDHLRLARLRRRLPCGGPERRMRATRLPLVCFGNRTAPRLDRHAD
jgi:hypothetical protein